MNADATHTPQALVDERGHEMVDTATLLLSRQGLGKSLLEVSLGSDPE